MREGGEKKGVKRGVATRERDGNFIEKFSINNFVNISLTIVY